MIRIEVKLMVSCLYNIIYTIICIGLFLKFSELERTNSNFNPHQPQNYLHNKRQNSYGSIENHDENIIKLNDCEKEKEKHIENEEQHNSLKTLQVFNRDFFKKSK